MWLNVVLPPGSLRRSQSSGTGPSASCGILLSYLPHGGGGSEFGENSFYRAPGGKSTQQTCARCPQLRYATGKPGKVQGLDHVGIVEGTCWYRARRVSIRGKILFYLETRGTRIGGSPCG